LPPFVLTSSSGSYRVLPILTITSTPASAAISRTFVSLSRAYASVSFSKTRCDIFQALKSFVRTICGASRTTNNFDFGFNFVIEEERSDWQSSLDEIHKKLVLIRAPSHKRQENLHPRRTHLQKLPSVRSYPSAIDIMRIPAPDRIQTFRLEIQGSFQGWRVMQAEVSSKPVQHSGF